MNLPPLPEPSGFRLRYRSEPGMIGHYPWTYSDQRRRQPIRPEHELQDLFTADQLRAYAEAAVLAERERCARVCDAMSPKEPNCVWEAAYKAVSDDCAAAIRALE